ncbi:hypothetical protein SAMN04489724_1445 [Algoriphagus locisalis]|uniref:Uncharacterized protein n=1 Tax=Algoriphagus locisalis TaxID=305507 RepID=A0A1I6ZSQ2_9BACT|nr:hypothetical protein [Algoriphagus locisalis]SFT65724.1 hypothetical protein SAMN04489724_1445 [Algoriphagus locisalis]
MIKKPAFGSFELNKLEPSIVGFQWKFEKHVKYILFIKILN